MWTTIEHQANEPALRQRAHHMTDPIYTAVAREREAYAATMLVFAADYLTGVSHRIRECASIEDGAVLLKSLARAAGALQAMLTIRISIEYDPAAAVWVAQSDDIALVAEAETIEALRAKLPGMVHDRLA